MGFRGKRSASRIKAELAHAKLIQQSSLFDEGWYMARYPDVREAGIDGALHFIRHGGSEARDPGPNFNTKFYLDTYSDVAAADINPLLHYLLHGQAEGRMFSPVSQVDVVLDDTAVVQPGLFAGSKFEELSISDPYEIARLMVESATPAELLARVSKSLYSPTISIVMPVYNTPPRFFREVLQSVFAQTYAKWELCVVDDGSSSPSSIAIFNELIESPDPRIKTLRLANNRGIVGASQSAFELATGEYVAFLDHDDLLTPNAFSEVVDCLRRDEAIDFVYSDHVMIDHFGNFRHYSKKPGWSPEFLLSTNYIVHLKVVRRSLLNSIGGLQDQIDNVQDLGITCALATAGARVAHISKPLYLWREHRTSVALSTQAKPGIEDLLIKVYDKYLNALAVPAKQTWPNTFKATRTGVFQLEFAGDRPKVALVLLSRDSDEEELDIRARFAPVLKSSVTLHIACLGRSGKAGIHIDNDAEMLDFLCSLDAEAIVFANTTAQFLGIDWLDRLSRYAIMDPMIGAVGGKTLDPYLQIRSGGMLLNADGEYRTIAGGLFDNEQGHWFNGQITSNVDAVASQLMATRRDALMEVGGIGFYAFGDAAGVAYSATLRKKGFRIVYDPVSRVCDVGRMYSAQTALTRLRDLGRQAAPTRVYEDLGA